MRQFAGCLRIGGSTEARWKLSGYLCGGDAIDRRLAFGTVSSLLAFRVSAGIEVGCT